MRNLVKAMTLSAEKPNQGAEHQGPADEDFRFVEGMMVSLIPAGLLWAGFFLALAGLIR
ncbi:MAG: hypothetical protein HY217_04725 [Candidatus Rokubacteria bacterium]|nr:hypothetical protein [Candidatus Rokubacteria bacterium]